jgi:hypothetical protein
MAELVSLWPVRSHVGNDAWLGLFERAQRRIDVLVYAGFWLSEGPAIRRLLSAKAESGVCLRFLLGDPRSAAVDLRGVEEGIGAAVSAKIDNTIHNYRGVMASPNTEFRVHATTLYNSVYRGDDEMLVNTHLYGLPGHMTPLMHLRRVPGAEFFAGYLDSFERIWDLGRPLDACLQVARWRDATTTTTRPPRRRTRWSLRSPLSSPTLTGGCYSSTGWTTTAGRYPAVA